MGKNDKVIPKEKFYECLKCGWIGPHHEMRDDWGWVEGYEEQVFSKFVCPSCNTFYNHIKGYKSIGLREV
jgi:predicted RNA-binding Zn-ribbon protein involved in translation (DUF1610 family)